MQDERSIRHRLGEAVNKLRTARHLSQEQLAERLSIELDQKISNTMISRLESGGRPTTVEELVALAHALEVPVTQITDRIDPKDEFWSLASNAASKKALLQKNLKDFLWKISEHNLDAWALWDTTAENEASSVHARWRLRDLMVDYMRIASEVEALELEELKKYAQESQNSGAPWLNLDTKFKDESDGSTS
ncbi:helix-turn-helix domain-containing protein [Dermabacter hominis]|uniref:helix-turn-helix domain-containing protein n=1 Tax=Dermabacter hominis TaxID=36740 RepID=UPI0021A3DBE3|nr:helix-turn-helix transcriptional regulator [Dermabacter hominis]MCT2055247.1 helix-turn-helix domain-containing protein [Dermabacter hominis]MCT2083496.1 helix-turn-helix domain-containing protein [Dermabacter hominis]MCT2090527.1 helix-turn-helix domain-containing protein [Dermabacter hominis]MCT2189597.1 helix-turn-helix domain-containing protein [Dermabacter hominis]MCT2227005.1 helix-turn-helix domain-containing protein [Dermabacter hominis]